MLSTLVSSCACRPCRPAAQSSQLLRRGAKHRKSPMFNSGQRYHGHQSEEYWCDKGLRQCKPSMAGGARNAAHNMNRQKRNSSATAQQSHECLHFSLCLSLSLSKLPLSLFFFLSFSLALSLSHAFSLSLSLSLPLLSELIETMPTQQEQRPTLRPTLTARVAMEPPEARMGQLAPVFS